MKLLTLGRSRGGLQTLSWAATNPEKVGGFAGIYPVCDLRSYPGLDKAFGAYGLKRAELEEQLDQHNPVARLAPLAKAGVPIFHIHGDTDTVVPLKDNSEEVARRYRGDGEVVVLGVDVQDLRESALQFVDRNGLTYPTLRDGEDDAKNAFQVPALPETFVIDPEGRIGLKIRGVVQQPDQLTTAIDQILAESR